VRGAADIMSFGTADRIAALAEAKTGIGGQQGDYAGNLAAERARDLQDPTARFVGQGVGALAIPGAASTIPRAAGLMAAQGAAYGAGSSPDYTNVPQVLGNAARVGGVGALAGGAGGMVARGVGSLLERAPGEMPAVTAANIGALKNAAYAKADQLGATYTPEAYGKLIDKVAEDAKAANISPDIHPAATAVISNLQLDAKARAITGEPITLTQLDQMRQVISRDVTSSSVKGEKALGKRMIGNIDEFVAKSGPEHMAAGSGPEAAAAIQNARDLNTRFEKMQAVEDATAKSERRTGYSGNVEDATRTKLIQAFEKRGNWTPEETDAFKQIFEGTAGQKILHTVGRFSPDSVIPALLEITTAGIAGPGALAVPAIGAAAKFASNRMAKGSVKKLASTILAGKGAPVVTKFGKFPRTAAGARALAAAMTARTIQGNQ